MVVSARTMMARAGAVRRGGGEDDGVTVMVCAVVAEVRQPPGGQRRHRKTSATMPRVTVARNSAPVVCRGAQPTPRGTPRPPPPPLTAQA